MVQHYYRNVHAVVIVYDVTKPETFHVSVELTTSVAERLVLCSLDEQVPGLMPGGTNLGNKLFEISSGCSV